MKLSLITPIYREIKHVSRFLDRLKGQTNINFEVVFVIDTSNENILGLIDNYKKDIKGEVKVIFNSKRRGRAEAVHIGIENATGEYAIIMSVTNSFDENMVDTVFKKIEMYQQPDIIEFNARFKDPIKFDGLIRKTIKTQEFNKEEVFAFTYPFDFNKIYKTSILAEAEKLPLIPTRINSRFSIDLVFRALLVAETYATTKTKIIRSKRTINTTFNPLKISREWDELMEESFFDKYKQSLEYNRYFVTKIIYSSLTNTTKNKVLIGKMNELIQNKFENSDFFAVNRFILMVNKETEILKKFRNQSSDKIIKVLNE